jgi:protein-disulfide isomerase
VPVLEQVLEKYPEEVKVVFKNFPLRNHRFARSAAVAALAANKQGKFWEFHDLLFKNYSLLNEQKIHEIAQKLNLDMEKFERSQRDREILGTVMRDLSEGTEAGVTGTPTLFVNGRHVRDRNLKVLYSIIDKELEKAKGSQAK